MAPRRISIKKLVEEIELLKNQLARALADYDNLRKRVEREREEFGRLANARLILRLLSVYDMLEAAQSHLHDSGLAITLDEFVKVIEDEGFEKIKVAVGDRFDEKVHEVVEAVNPPAGGEREKGEEGLITQVVLLGWRIIDGPVIRPTKVKVTKKAKN